MVLVEWTVLFVFVNLLIGTKWAAKSGVGRWKVWESETPGLKRSGTWLVCKFFFHSNYITTSPTVVALRGS